jgi:hypothetical protein
LLVAASGRYPDRFFISFYRVNNIIFLGMREAQLFAVAGIVLASIAGYWLILRAKKRGRLFH